MLQHKILHVEHLLLTHWSRDKMDAILQMAYQMHFIEWKLFKFQTKSQLKCSLGSNLQYVSISSDNVLIFKLHESIQYKDSTSEIS